MLIGNTDIFYNFRIQDNNLGAGGPKAKYKANISFVRILLEKLHIIKVRIGEVFIIEKIKNNKKI